MTSAAETAKVISHCTEVVGNERILTPGMGVLAGAQHSLRDASEWIPFFDLTNAGHRWRAVSFLSLSDACVIRYWTIIPCLGLNNPNNGVCLSDFHRKS